MTVATQNRIDILLTQVLREIREVHSLMKPSSRAMRTISAVQKNISIKSDTKRKEKLPGWLQSSLKDVEEGRVSGSFNTVAELMADLKSPGE